MQHVFLSYSRQDSPFVRAVADALRSRGVPIWIDVNDIPFSLPWLSEITDAVQEAVLVVRFESEARRGSAACAAEDEVARRLNRPMCPVLVDDDLDATVGRILRALREVPPRDKAGIELAVRARDWERSGRPRGQLLSKRARRGLTRLAPPGPDTREAVYVRASARRSRRRAQLTAGAITITVVAASVAALLWGTKKYEDGVNARAAANIQAVNSAMRSLGADPYADLRTAAAEGTNESYVQARLLETVLAEAVPNDAFRAPTSLAGFASSPVSGEVVVRDVHGRPWSRARTATTKRTASPSAAKGTAVAPPLPVGVSVTPASGLVTIRRDGGLSRTMTVPGAEPMAALSPDGRFLAVATAAGAAVVDVESGQTRVSMVGAPAPVSAVAWDAGSSQVWATAGRTVVAWQFREGRVLVDRPGQWLSAVLPSAVPRTVWIVTREGQLQLIDVVSGAVRREFAVRDTIYSARSDPAGDSAVLIGASGAWNVDLTAARTTHVDLGNCASGAPAVADDGSVAYLPCVRGPVATLARGAAQLGPEQNLFPDGVAALGTAPGGALVAADERGVLYSWRPGAAPSRLYALQCAPEVSTVAVAWTGSVYEVGTGTGLVGCAEIGARAAGAFQWGGVLADVDSTRALGAVFSADGKAFGTGFDNGIVELRPSANVAPAHRVIDVSGGVRDMLTVGGHLYLVSRTGVLEDLDWCEECLTNRSFALVARQRLARAHELGLTALLPP